MRVAVTGGTGFLGGHVVDHLVENGHETVCLVRPTSDRAHLDGLGIQQVPGSLGDPQSLKRLVKDADAVIHIAGTVAAHDKSGYYQANSQGTRNLLAAANENPPDNLSYVSSLAAKGPSPSHRPRPAGDTPRPVSVYGQSKLDGETAVRDFAQQTDIPATIIRPPALYGPRDQRILGLMKAARRGLYAHLIPHDAQVSLLYGPDCARLVAETLEAPHPSNPIRLLEPAYPTAYTSADICKNLSHALDGKRLRELRIPAFVLVGAAGMLGLTSRLLGPARMLNPDKVRELRAKHWLSDTSTLDGTHWTPAHDLTQGFQKTYQWFEKEGWL